MNKTTVTYVDEGTVQVEETQNNTKVSSKGNMTRVTLLADTDQTVILSTNTTVSVADTTQTIVTGAQVQKVNVSSVSLGGSGVTDHGNLSGLEDDDHSQYHTDFRGDERYSPLGHTHPYLPEEAISSDSGNIASLGSDDLVYVPSSGGGGTFDHEELVNRENADQHPQEAITGLVTDQGDQDTAIGQNTANIASHVADKTNPHDVTFAQTNPPATFPPDAHNHDDLYYTEAEINAQQAIQDQNLIDHEGDKANPHEVTYAQLPDKPTIPPAQTYLHDDLTDVTSDQHHAQSHTHDGLDGSGTVAHADLTGITEDDHHAEIHDLTSHSDVVITSPKANHGLWWDDITSAWVNGAAFEESWPTGLVYGGELNIGPGANDVEVIAGTGVISNTYDDPLSPPALKGVRWEQINTAITAAPAVAGSVVWISIYATATPSNPPIDGGVQMFVGELRQYAQGPSPTLARQEVFLGVVIHNGDTWNEVSNPKVINQAAETLRELVVNVLPLSHIISGGTTRELPGPPDFQIEQDEGVIWENNRNWHNDKSDPNRESLSAQAPVTFKYVNRDFTDVGTATNVFDPGTWDNNGTVDTIPGSGNTATIQRLYLDPANNYWVLYGQNTYANFFTAEANLLADGSKTVVPFILQSSILLGYSVCEKGKNGWDVNEAVWIPNTGAVASGGGGTPITDHGNLAGLADDDHTQYLNETRHDALPADNPHSVTAAQTGAEPELGNPSADGDILSSTIAGTRSWITPALGGSVLPTGHKNVLINPQFIVNQRGFDGNWAGLSNFEYGWDRWFAINGVTAMSQRIEVANLIDGAYVLSWEGGGTASATRTDNTLVSGTTSPLQINTLIGTATNDYASVTLPLTSTNIQLEQGSVATPLEVRNIQQEFAMCQRYYYRHAAVEGSNYYTGAALSDLTAVIISFPTTMRANPSISTDGGNSFNNCGYSGQHANFYGYVMRASTSGATWYNVWGGTYYFDAEL